MNSTLRTKAIMLCLLASGIIASQNTQAQTCTSGSAVTSTGYGFVAWGGSAHAQNAIGAPGSPGTALTPTNSAILQDLQPLYIDMGRLVPQGNSIISILYSRFSGSGSATANVDGSVNGTTWTSLGTLSRNASPSAQANFNVGTGGLRYLRITSTSAPASSMLIDGVTTTHYCPVPVSSTRATRSFYAPGTNKGTLATNVYPANAQQLQFTTITSPTNGTWTLNSSTGAYTYVPNAGFDGFEVGVFRVCDGGADGDLSTTGDNVCDQDTILLRAVFNCDTNLFYVPIPEDQAYDFLRDIDQRTSGRNDVPLNVYMGFSVTSDAVVTYDHWEDGFETNPRNPTQSTTQIWGDGDLRNGIAPGTTNDILAGGTTMILQNLVLSVSTSGTSSLQSIVDYDGRDKILVHGIGALSKLDWGTVLTLSVSGAAVPRTEFWGNNYTLPAAQNTANGGSMFEIASASIIAQRNGTTVNIDYNRDGTTDITTTLNEGETYYFDSRPSGTAPTVNQGATITANNPIQVMYMTGNQGTVIGSSLYGGRTFPLVPDAQLSTCYVVPAINEESVRVFLYNPTGSTITITRTAPGGTTTTFNIAANSSTSQVFAVGNGNGYQYCSGSSAFTMIACVDDDGITSDWGFVPTAGGNLQQIILMSLGFGQDPTSNTFGANNHSRLFVTPTTNTYFYADFNGDKIPDKFSINDDIDVTDAAITIGGGTYNETTSDNGVLVSAYRTLSIAAPDGDMSGAVIWTKTASGNAGSFGGEFAAIWGQNGGPAADPNIDAGYNLPPKILPPLNTTVRVRFPDVCPGSTTDSIHFNITGGTSPYRIQWINLGTGENSVYSFNPDSTKIAGIKPGTYIIKIRDANCLNYQTTVTISQKTTGCNITISGNVFDDGNALTDSKVNTFGSGTLSSTPLYANLLNAAGTQVVATQLVSSGAYSFANVPASTNYIVQLSTNQGTVGSAAPAVALPTNWVNTGENIGLPTVNGNDGTVNSLISVTGGTTNITNVNFGIQQRPESNSLSMTPQNNPGIGTYVQVGTLTGTDNEDGTLNTGETIVISSLPTNGTLRYNGTAVTLNQVIPNYDPTLLQVTPSFSGAGTVSFTYAWRDVAGFNDLTPATVDVPFLGSISGTVFDDGDGLSDATVDGTGLGNPSSTTLYANLLNTAGTSVIATVAVNTNGTYTFNGLSAASYNVQISTNQGTVGAAPPTTALPTNWVNTGENLGTAAGNDGTVNGTLTSIVLGTTAVTNANFGIDQRPTSNNLTMTAQNNPGVGTYVQVGTLTGADLEDGTLNAGERFVITSLPSNGTLRYNGTAVTLNQVISNYDPTLLQVTPSFSGAGTVSFTYAWRDAAGFDDLSPASVDVPFLGSISGNVFDDGDGLSDLTVDGSGLGNPSSTTLYANLLNTAGTSVVATVAVNTNGTYAFNGLSASTYRIQISTNQGTVGNTPPATALPTNWVNTGENLGTAAGNDGTVNGTLTPVVLGTTAVTNANFGIDERPTSNNLSMTPQNNPGVGTYVQVGTLTGADLEDGTLNAGERIVITSLPTNGTLRYNGTAVTLNQVIPNYDPTLLQVTPSFSGAGTVSFTYAWRDAAGFDDLTPASVDVPFLGSISGTVFDDGDGLVDLTVDGTGLGNPSTTTLYANLLNAAGTSVLATVAVNTNGTYNFNGLAATNYQVQISTNQGTVGNTPPASALPTDWVYTGENVGTGAGNDGTVNGTLTPITLGTTAVTNANFGIDQRPTSNNATASSQTNPGGTVQVTVPTLSGADLEDGTLGSTNTIVVTSLPANATLYYNGTAVNVNQVISNYNPSLLTVDPSFNGAGTVTFNYAWRDAAGFDDLSPATVTMPFDGLLISGSVLHDNDGNSDLNVDGPGISNPASTQLWAYLIDNGNVVDSAQVRSTGTYSFDIVNANTAYSVRISSTRVAVGAAAPSVTLPANWVTTGEEFGSNNAAGSGLESGIGNGIILVTTNSTAVSGVDFGIEYAPYAHDKYYTITPDSIILTTGVSSGFTHYIRLNTAAGTADSTVNSSSTAVMPGLLSGFDLEENRYEGASGRDSARVAFTTLPDTNNALLQYNGIRLIPNPTVSDPSWIYWNNTAGRYEIPNFRAANLILLFKMAYQSNTSFNYGFIDSAGILGRIGTYSLNYTVPLPINLSELFCATGRGATSLTWGAYNVGELQSMYVLRSVDGAPFTRIASFTQFDRSKQVQYFSYLDRQTEAAQRVYKIEAHDLHGVISYTNPCFNANQGAVEAVKISAVPNPTDGLISVNIQTPADQNFNIRIQDASGRLLIEKTADVEKVMDMPFDLSNYAPGIYNIVVRWEGKSEVIRIVRM